MTENDFGKMCRYYGFAKLAPRFYARCVGDGVYQTICTGFRKYVSPMSPMYSENNRRSYSISIGVRSLFSHWTDEEFCPGLNIGGYSPADLGNYPDAPFEGVQKQYEEMAEFGFSALQQIDSQENLLTLYESTHKLASGDRIHDTSLIAPFFMVGKAREAIYELCYDYTHFMSNFQKINRRLINEGMTSQYYELESDVLERHNVTVTLWNAWLSNDYHQIENYLRENSNINLQRVHKNGIPIDMSSFSLRKIPGDFRINA